MSDFDDMISAKIAAEVARQLAARDRPAEYLTTDGAAALAGVAAGTIRRWIREGRIDEHRAGRMVRVRRADMEALLARGRRRPADAIGSQTPEQLARRDMAAIRRAG
jgi:excisionase family DNA binding protein